MAIHIVVTGPESVGKSTLVSQLSDLYGGVCEYEYARDYVTGLDRPYEYDDLLNIAEHQIKKFDEYSAYDGIIFYDTFLEVTYVWFDHVYHKIPQWFNRKYQQRPVDLYLLCKPDIPWVNDPLRENGHIRELLYEKYKEVIKSTDCDFELIEGQGKERLNNVIDILKKKNITPIK